MNYNRVHEFPMQLNDGSTVRVSVLTDYDMPSRNYKVTIKCNLLRHKYYCSRSFYVPSMERLSFDYRKWWAMLGKCVDNALIEISGNISKLGVHFV